MFFTAAEAQQLLNAEKCMSMNVQCICFHALSIVLIDKLTLDLKTISQWQQCIPNDTDSLQGYVDIYVAPLVSAEETLTIADNLKVKVFFPFLWKYLSECKWGYLKTLAYAH